jgi:hypothetical protein
MDNLDAAIEVDQAVNVQAVEADMNATVKTMQTTSSSFKDATRKTIERVQETVLCLGIPPRSFVLRILSVVVFLAALAALIYFTIADYTEVLNATQVLDANNVQGLDPRLLDSYPGPFVIPASQASFDNTTISGYPAPFAETPTGLVVYLAVLQLNTDNSFVSLFMAFSAIGSLRGLGATPTISFTVLINGHSYFFKAGRPLKQLYPIQLTLPIGTITNYPFDRHIGAFEFYAFVNVNSTLPDGSDGSYGGFIPIGVVSQTDLATFDVVPTWQIMTNDYQPNVSIATDPKFHMTFTAQRTSTTKGIAIANAVLMWVMSLSLFTFVLDIFWRRRTIDGPGVGFSVSLLFALPAFRNSLSPPGGPPLGSYLDLGSFFWCLALVSISSTAMMLRYLFQWQTIKPPVPFFPFGHDWKKPKRV